MKKLVVLFLMVFATSSFAMERIDPWGNLISNRCNGFSGAWFVYFNEWALVGSACRLPTGEPGTVGG